MPQENRDIWGAGITRYGLKTVIKDQLRTEPRFFVEAGQKSEDAS